MTAAALKRQVREDVAGARSAVKSLLNQAMNETPLTQTAARLRKTADAMEAHERGEPVEFYDSEIGGWMLESCPRWCANTNYRPAPKPVTRPWSKPDDVPCNCWLKHTEGSDWTSLILSVCTQGIFCVRKFDGAVGRVAWEELRKSQYSTDRKTWLPCVVTEDAK